jgi:hypothetical protein
VITIICVIMAQNPAHVPNISGWRPANDQSSKHSLPFNDLSQGSTMAWGIQSTDDDLLSALQNDNPAFLMGLTRLDLLDFSGLT